MFKNFFTQSFFLHFTKITPSCFATDNFWDDPYDIIMREANNIMDNVDQQAIDELIKDCVPQLSPDQAQMIRNNLLVRSLNKSVDVAESGFICLYV